LQVSALRLSLHTRCFREKGHADKINDLLKITAIGTVADIMQLTGRNRSIVALGLRDLPKTKNWGLKALMEVADCRSDMTSYDIGFRIAPRINAAGRMEVAKHVVDLLECEDFNEARRLANLLDSRNRERQKMQQQITELALLETDKLSETKFVVVSGEGWHRGVIGLAASRIAERVYRPTIVLSCENGVAHGSARGIPNFHLLQAMESCSELFEQFGGHAAAAGMKLKTGEHRKSFARCLISMLPTPFQRTNWSRYLRSMPMFQARLFRLRRSKNLNGLSPLAPAILSRYLLRKTSPSMKNPS
jgi:single-stranded DNA-specific DHH superfamily exonuclease